MSEAKYTPMSNTETAPIGIALGSAFIKEAEMWTRAHSDFLARMEAMMNDWMQRQREVFDASSRLIQRLCESHNIIDIVQAQQEWASDCVHWTASEIRAVGNDATATTKKAAEWLGEAVRERGDRPLQKAKARTKTEADHSIQRAAAE
jgi:phasin protein